MKNKGVLVSFIGTRGSGKTTVANLFCEQMEKNEFRCARQHPGFKRKPFLPSLINAIGLWRFFDLRMLKNFGFRGRRKLGRLSLYRLYLPLALSHDLNQVAKGRKDVLIYDSNILRGIISAIASGEMSAEELQKLYQDKILSKVDQIVFVIVNTEPTEAVARWIARDKVNLSDEEIQEAINERVTLMKNTDIVIDILSKIPHVSIVHLDGSIPANQNARTIFDFINTRVF